MEWKKPQLPEYALQRIKKSQEELIERSEHYLNLTQRGFRLSYLATESVKVIFNSEQCRVKIRLYHPGPSPRDDELYFSYGRLHAPDVYPYMTWNGEECECWHDIRFLCLFFLEGYSPHEVKSNFDSVPFVRKYEQSEEGSRLRRDEPVEFGFRLQSLIWERYGKRLFELFDLRHPELWEQYRAWLKARYIAEGRNEAEDEKKGFIPYYRVC